MKLRASIRVATALLAVAASVPPPPQPFAWVRHGGSNAFEKARSIGVDPLGNVIMGGNSTAPLSGCWVAELGRPALCISFPKSGIQEPGEVPKS